MICEFKLVCVSCQISLINSEQELQGSTWNQNVKSYSRHIVYCVAGVYGFAPKTKAEDACSASLE